jgi:predicted TIM-barrel fold metal-dependent hydrolase
MRKSVWAHPAIPLAALSCLAACSRPPAGQQTEPVALKDYHPESSLRVPLGHIDKARYLAIDVHSHSKPLMTTLENVTEWVAMMDATGVEATVVISDAIGAEFEGQARLFLGKYRNRFQLYCSLDHRDFENADFPQRAVRELERCYRAGARGLGELTDKGWGLMGGLEALAPDQELKAPPRDKRLNVDDPRLDPLWEKCAELNLPVILHVADHPSSYRPLGPTQERIPAYDRFNNYGKDVPTFDELMTMRDRVLARHPRCNGSRFFPA